MPAFAVQILRFVDDHFPGVVECEFYDACGRAHRVIEKAPIVSAEVLSADSAYPQSGTIACEIQKEWRDEMGRALVSVSTDRPWGIESTEGQTSFEMLASEMLRYDVD